MASQLDLPSERLVHRRHLERIADNLPLSGEELMRTIPLSDWQREHLETSLLALLNSQPNPAKQK